MKVNFLRAMNVTAELPIWLFWNQILNIWLFLRHLAKSVFFWLFFNRKGLALAKHCLSCIFIANLFWRESITMQGAQILQRFYCCPKNVRLYLLKLTVRLSLQFFFSVPLWAFEQASSAVMHIITFVCIVDICSGKNFTLYTFHSDYSDTSLNRHYLTNKVVRINKVWLYWRHQTLTRSILWCHHFSRTRFSVCCFSWFCFYCFRLTACCLYHQVRDKAAAQHRTHSVFGFGQRWDLLLWTSSGHGPPWGWTCCKPTPPLRKPPDWRREGITPVHSACWTGGWAPAYSACWTAWWAPVHSACQTVVWATEYSACWTGGWAPVYSAC